MMSSNMLLLLLCLAAVSHVTVAASFRTSHTQNVNSCPIYFFGRVYTNLYINTVGGRIGICFTGPYNPTGGPNDCFVIPQRIIFRGQLLLRGATSGTLNFIKQRLPQITGSATCFWDCQFFDQRGQVRVIVNFMKIDTQGIIYFIHSIPQAVDIVMQVNGVTQLQKTVSRHTIVLEDISACRLSGAVLQPGTNICDSEFSVGKCDASAVLTSNPCRPGSFCQDSLCVFDSVCSVTSSSVINLAKQVAPVPDRCAYTLMSEPGVQLLAVFQDRRRRDVTFLDQVILRLDNPGVNIYLGQGGRVQLDDTQLSLDSSPQLHHGVELSKDRTGVTANLMRSDHNTSIFFNGYTAQIYFKGLYGDSPEGLCDNSKQSLSTARVSEFSSSGCKAPYSDAADSRINCTTATEHCNLLKEAPFTTCHNDTDPEPYVAACIDTLCKYPAMDGLSCQFLEAYARACSLESKATLEDWRSKARCPSPQALCQDKFCSAHEFCGDNISGGTSCFCRAIFASKYRSTDSLGEATVCRHNSASLTLVGCLLEEKGIKYSALHLNDENCKGQLDHRTNMVAFSFNSSNTCGTVVMANNSQIIYKNSIMTRNTSSIITRQDQVKLDFSCYYSQPDIKSMSFRIKDSSVIQQIISGAWNYTLTMKAYADARRTQAVESSTEIQLEQAVWVELKTDGLDDNLVAIVTDSCWATNQPSPSGSLRYDLILNGCSNPADQSVEVMANGLGTSNYFSFNMFQFSGSSSDVFLHCKLNLCVKTKNKSCAPSCSRANRRRRSVKYEDDFPAFITMAWTN